MYILNTALGRGWWLILSPPLKAHPLFTTVLWPRRCHVLTWPPIHSSQHRHFVRGTIRQRAAKTHYTTFLFTTINIIFRPTMRAREHNTSSRRAQRQWFPLCDETFRDAFRYPDGGGGCKLRVDRAHRRKFRLAIVAAIKLRRAARSWRMASYLGTFGRVGDK